MSSLERAIVIAAEGHAGVVDKAIAIIEEMDRRW
jgi:hypothetical protein